MCALNVVSVRLGKAFSLKWKVTLASTLVEYRLLKPPLGYLLGGKRDYYCLLGPAAQLAQKEETLISSSVLISLLNWQPSNSQQWLSMEREFILYWRKHRTKPGPIPIAV